MEKQDPRYVIGSILAQLLSQLPKDDRAAKIAPVASVYETDVYKGNNYRVRDLDDSLFRILEDLVIKLAEPFYVIIDGLDEIESTMRPRLLSFLKTLWANTSIKLLLTSRPETDIKQAFNEQNLPELPISENAVQQDIFCYVKWQLENDPDLCKIKSKALKADIERTLLKRSGGM